MKRDSILVSFFSLALLASYHFYKQDSQGISRGEASPFEQEEPETSPPPPSQGGGGNTTLQDFSEAKRKAWGIFRGMERTFYCDCPYEGKIVDISSCGYQPLNPSEARSHQIEWEHIVPAHAFGQSFKEWREGHPSCVNSQGKSYKGRKCAQKVSPEFARMEADLYNLVPAIGEVNRVRSNHSYGLLPDMQKNLFGACDFKTDGTTVQPREAIRGFIARTYLYMEDAYPGHGIISRKNQKLFEAWNKMHPVTEQEKLRARRVRVAQGNNNKFVLP